MKNQIRIAILLMLAVFLPIQAVTAASDINQQRKLYQQAKKALQTHQLTQFRQLQDQLEGYPLQEYLDYLYLQHRINDTEAANIKRFLQTREDSFFKARLRGAWLDKLADNQQWHQYLEFYQAPQSAARECHYARALIATNQQQAAAEAFEKLWLVAASQDKACDAVFHHAEQRGWLTDELRWQRLLLALRNQQFALANYLAKTVKQSATAQAWTKRWEDIHTNPVSLLSQLPAQAPAQGVSLAQDVDMAREIIVYGLKRLARNDPAKAHYHWTRLENSYQFSTDERHDVQGSIGPRWIVTIKHFIIMVIPQIIHGVSVQPYGNKTGLKYKKLSPAWMNKHVRKHAGNIGLPEVWQNRANVLKPKQYGAPWWMSVIFMPFWQQIKLMLTMR